MERSLQVIKSVYYEFRKLWMRGIATSLPSLFVLTALFSFLLLMQKAGEKKSCKR